MPTFLFEASKIKKDNNGKEQLADDSPFFETSVEAQNNSDAIQIGIEKFLIQHPTENLDNFVVGAITWKQEAGT